MKSSADILKAMRSPTAGGGGAAGGGLEEHEAMSAPMPEPVVSSPGKSPKGGGGSPKSRILTLKGVIPLNLGLDRVMTVRTGGHTPEFDALVPPGGQPGQIWHFKVETGEPGERWNIVESIEFEVAAPSHLDASAQHCGAIPAVMLAES